MNFLSRAWSAAFGTFKNVFAFLLPVLQSSVGQSINELLPVALDIATQAQKSNSPDKYAFAFKRLEDALTQQGKVLPERTLNLILELAVNKLKTP